ncbi:MAG: UbiD family decarboxylase [Chloroflexi bacterium]|nr:UbiD family decarboxylase [Chloroflexota bacterium]
MAKKDITSLRGTLDFLKKEGELLEINEVIDPIYEISGVQKVLENGPTILFNKIRGYPHARDVGNIFSRKDRPPKIFGFSNVTELRLACREALAHPLPPKVVKDAPSQEVVITKDIDVMGYLPITKYTERDGARIIGGNNTFLSGKWHGGGTHLSFNRLNFRWPAACSLAIGAGSHLESAAHLLHRGEQIPVTLNIGTPPACMMIAGAGFLHPLVPVGGDELGFAGRLQGKPVEIVKARTQDTYALAESEWVLEGYIDTKQKAWESDEAEKLGKEGVAPVFPEWTGYLGRAYRLLLFKCTAITHRKDRPIFFTPQANSFEGDMVGSAFREACFWEIADRIRPGLVTDVNIIEGVAGWGGNIVFQVRKRSRADEGYQRQILSAAQANAIGLRMAVAVDEDIDIYSADDVLWAITTRVNPRRDMIVGAGGGMGQVLMPMERIEMAQGNVQYSFEGGMAFDATVPFENKWNFERSKHPVDKVDLKKWVSEKDISRIKAQQSDYAKLMARKG